MLSPNEKIPSTGGSEEGRTHDAASCRTGSPTHYRLSYSSLYFDTSLIDLEFDSRSQECEKEKLLCQLSHKVVNQFEWNIVTIVTVGACSGRESIAG